MQSASTNITTFPGKVGISNANPTHTLAIGSNVYVDDTGSNKLTVTGVISGDGLGISNIQTVNVLGLTDNVTRIGTLETDLDNNSSRISTVSTDLSDNSSRISIVSTDLSDNSSRITNLSSNLSDNSSRISTVSTDLSDNSSRISTVSTDLSDNSSRISTVSTDLSDNSSRISTVSTDLSDNSSRISTVSTDLSDNSSRISTVSTDLSDNSSRITSLESGASSISGVKTFQDDIILESNLRVNGSLTYANTVNMIVSDPIIELGANNQHTNDLGLVLTRHGNLGNDSNVAIFYDESQDTLKIGYTDNSASETTLTTTATGLDVSITGNVAAAYDTDTTSYLGRAAVGYMGQSDQASFSHLDKNTSANFALKQAASGATHINTPTGQHIRFSVNASEVGRFSGGGDFKVGANKLYVDTSASEVQMYSQATGSTAGPDLVLMRDNGSNAGSNNQYIGQIRYEGLSDTGNSRLYAKTTGKIKTATNGSEDGVIETMIKTGGSNRISVRHSGAKFLIQKGTDLQVGEVANLYVDTSTSRVGINVASPSYTLDVGGDVNLSTGSTLRINGIPAVFSNWTASGSDIYRSSGNVGIGTTSPQYKLDVDGGTAEGDGDVMLRMFGGVNKVGKLIFGRTGNSDIRSHAIESITNSGGANNYMKFLVHDGGNSPPYETRTEVMTLLGNGNVGIGTASPAAVLDVFSSPHVTGYREMAHFRVSNTSDDSDFTRLIFGQVATNKMFLETTNEANTKGDLLLQPYGGNVGIGTTNPNKGNLSVYGLGADPYFTGFNELNYADATDFTGLAHFHSSGSHGVIRISNSADKTGTTRIDFNTTLGAYWGVNSPQSSYFRGTAPTAGRIMVRGEIDNNYEDSFMTFHTCRDLRVDGVGGTGNLYERMRITSEGNVGIGTVSPTSKLELAANGGGSIITLKRTNTSNGGAKGGIRFTENTNGYNVGTIACLGDGANTSGALCFYTKASSTHTGIYLPTTDERMRITSTGNVGIGLVDPKNKLDVRSDNYATFGKATYNAAGWSGIRLGTPYATNHDAYCSVIESYNNHVSNYNSDLRFKTSNGNNASGNERMRITSAGNVGIGTASPVAALDFGSSIRNRIINLWGSNTNGSSSTDFYGFGINASTLRYNVYGTADVHKFYGGSTEYGYINNASGFVNSFTGQHKSFPHESLFGKTSEDLCGLIVSASGEHISINDSVPQKGQGAIQVSEAIPTVKLSVVEKDKKVFGVVSDVEDVETSQRHDHYGAFVSTFEKELGDSRIYVNSIGEGAMWVVNTAGTLESGDYITTSNVAGYGQRQDSDSLKNYTVAKITMDCDFAPATQPIQIIKKELQDVNYWVNATYENVSLEEYSNLAEDVRTTTTEIYYSNEDGEITTDKYNTLESNVQSTYTELTRTIHQKISTEEYKTEQEGTTLEVRQELVNVLDEHGQLQWEDHPTDTEKAYKIRYLTSDGTQTDEANAVHIAAFVGCTYHCG